MSPENGDQDREKNTSRRRFRTADLPDEEVDEIASARMDSRHDHLNQLLERNERDEEDAEFVEWCKRAPRQVITLSPEAFDHLVEMLEHPPEPNEKLMALARRFPFRNAKRSDETD
jgi:Protein of unknown function (DUF1778)